MKRILILGAGGHGQVVADILLAARRSGAPTTPVGFLDDDPRLAGTAILGLPVLGPLRGWPHASADALIVAVGDNQVRRALLLFLQERGAVLANAVHPAAVIAAGTRLGAGVVFAPRAVVNTGTAIADGAILNTGCTVDHHNHIGAFAHVAPGANLGGNVTVGEGALVGIGAAVIPGCTIGDWAVVGAGSVVTTDIPPGAVAVGAPARVVKQAISTEELPLARTDVLSQHLSTRD